jgi:hypothetical protein
MQYTRNRIPMDTINPILSLKYPNTHNKPIKQTLNRVPIKITCLGNLFNENI